MTQADNTTLLPPSTDEQAAKKSPLPVWPSDIPEGICRITDNGEIVSMAGCMIPQLKQSLKESEYQAGQESFGNPLSEYILKTAATEWDAIHVTREHAPKIITILEQIARSCCDPARNACDDYAYFVIASMAAAINALALPSTSDTLYKYPLASVRFCGPYLSIALANPKSCPLADIAMRRYSLFKNECHFSWCMSDTIPLSKTGGTEIIFDLTKVIGATESDFSTSLFIKIQHLLRDVLTPLMDVHLRHNKQRPHFLETEDRLNNPHLAYRPIPILITSTPYSDLSNTPSDEIPLAVFSNNISVHCMMLHAMVKAGIPCSTTNPQSSDERSFFLCDTAFSVKASDLPRLLDAMRENIARLDGFDTGLLLTDAHHIPTKNRKELAHIEIDTGNYAVILTGLLIASKRDVVIRIADQYRISQSLRLADSGDGYKIELSEIQSSSALENFLISLDSVLSGIARFLNETYQLKTPIPLLELTHDNTIQITSPSRFGTLIAMRVVDPELNRRVQYDLISAGWGWREISDVHEAYRNDDARLFYPGHTVIEYLINIESIRSDIVFQQTRNIFRHHLGLHDKNQNDTYLLAADAKECPPIEPTDEYSVPASKTPPQTKSGSPIKLTLLTKIIVAVIMLIAMICLHFIYD